VGKSYDRPVDKVQGSKVVLGSSPVDPSDQTRDDGEKDERKGVCGGLSLGGVMTGEPHNWYVEARATGLQTVADVMQIELT
jgi:hypothetical protein